MDSSELLLPHTPLPGSTIRILHVESDPDDQLRVQQALQDDCGRFEVVPVNTLGELTAQVEERHWDAILCDYQLDGFTVLTVLERLRELHSAIPLIVVSGAVGEERATSLLMSGAYGFVSKHNLRRLRPVINRLMSEITHTRELRYIATSLENQLQARIGELETASRALGESEAKFRRIFDSNIIGIIYAHKEGRILDANDAFLDMCGYSRQELEAGQLNWMEMTPPEYLALDLENVEKVASGLSIPAYESQILHKDGRRIDNLLCYAMLAGSTDTGLAFVLDITEKKTAERALRDRESILRNAQRLAHMGHWEIDLNTKVNFWSEEVFELFGYKPHEIPASYKQFMAVVHPADRRLIEAKTAEALETGEITGYDYRILHRNGSIRYLNAQAEVLHDETGKPCKLRGVVMDITARKEAELAIEEASQFHLATLDALSQHIAILDEEGNILAVNQAWQQFGEQHGISYQTAYRNYFAACRTDLFQGEYAQQALDGMQAVLSGREKLFVLEYPCETPERRYWFRMSVTRFEGQGIKRLVISHEDITERKQAEEALEASDRFYRATLNALTKHVAILDESGVILATNTSWEQFGVDSGTFRPTIGENFFTGCKMKGRYRDLALDGIRQVLEKKLDIFKLEYPWQAPRKLYWFRMSVTRFEWPGMLRLVLSHEDITDRLAAEQAIKTLTGQNQALLDNISDFAYMKDDQFRYIAVNEPAAAFCKKTPDEMIGKTDFQLFPTEVARNFRRDDELVLSRNRSVSFEEEITLDDGSRIWLETIKSPIRDPDGRLIGVAGIGRDITQRKTAESMLVASHDHLEQLVAERTAELEKAYSTLKENEQLRGNFVSALTHDLRTPLIAQKRLVELLQENGEQLSDSQQKFLLDGLLKNNDNLLDMVNKLLETYQYVEGRIRIEPEAFNLYDLVNECLADLQGIADQKRIRLENQVARVSSLMVADPALLKRVFINLINNAIDNIPEHCVVEVSTRYRPDEGWLIHVSDNGLGIESDLLPHMFDRYFAKSGKRQKIGSGLGLYICKMIVELHGGSISVESEVGHGATFILRLPNQPESEGILD